jgi:hypothetical protein
MSHFTTVKTQILEKETLLEVLRELRYNITFEKTLKGYRNQVYGVDFQINVGGNPDRQYNIGFIKNGNSYDIVGDLYYIPNHREIIGKIKQNYAKKIVVRNIRRQGYNVIEEKSENNTIKMVVVKR